jgi:hypothetical protein
MSTTRETILAALQARLLPLSANVLRDDVLPERIPTAGLITRRDGQPGEADVVLSPLRHHYSTAPSWNPSSRRAAAAPHRQDTHGGKGKVA